MTGAAKGSKEPSLPNAVPQHLASAEKIALRDRPNAVIRRMLLSLCCGPSDQPFAAGAKSEAARTHATRTKRPFRSMGTKPFHLTIVLSKALASPEKVCFSRLDRMLKHPKNVRRADLAPEILIGDAYRTVRTEHT